MDLRQSVGNSFEDLIYIEIRHAREWLEQRGHVSRARVVRWEKWQHTDMLMGVMGRKGKVVVQRQGSITTVISSSRKKGLGLTKTGLMRTRTHTFLNQFVLQSEYIFKLIFLVMDSTFWNGKLHLNGFIRTVRKQNTWIQVHIALLDMVLERCWSPFLILYIFSKLEVKSLVQGEH